MATYAGYQRYEVPDIGGNVAKIMMAQNEQNDRRAAQQQANDIRKAKMEADKAKTDAKGAKDIENEIDKNATRIGEKLSTTTATGFETTDAVFQGSIIPQVKTGMAEIEKAYRNGEIGSAQYKTAKQSYENVANETKVTADGLNKAFAKMNEAKNPSPYKKWAINETMSEVNPTPDSPTNVKLLRQPNGEIKKVVQSFKKDENGNDILVSETPYHIVNSMSAMTDFEMPNLDQMASTMADNVGKKAVEIKAGGGTKTDIDDAIQQNFKDTKQVFVNTTLAQPVNAADAYVQLVVDPSRKAIFVKEDAPESYKRMLADNNGYLDKPLSEVNFVVSKKGKDGMYIPELNKEQKEQLSMELGKMFDNKADKIVSINTPSKNVTNVNVVNNPKAQTDRTRTSYAMDLNNPVGVKAATSGLENAMASGKIARYGGKAKLPNGQLIDASPILVKDKNGQYTGEIKFHKIIGKTSSGNPIASPYKTTINVNNPDDAGYFRIEFGEITDASGDIIDLEATRNKKGTDK